MLVLSLSWIHYISCSCNQPDDVVPCCSDATVVHRVHHDVVQRDEMV
jgi:hypothetical protein